jgi:hypothetical protein
VGIKKMLSKIMIFASLSLKICFTKNPVSPLTYMFFGVYNIETASIFVIYLYHLTLTRIDEFNN